MRFNKLIEHMMRMYPEYTQEQEQPQAGTADQLAQIATNPMQAKKAQTVANAQKIATDKLRKQIKIRAQQEVQQIRQAVSDLKKANAQGAPM